MRAQRTTHFFGLSLTQIPLLQRSRERIVSQTHTESTDPKRSNHASVRRGSRTKHKLLFLHDEKKRKLHHLAK